MPLAARFDYRELIEAQDIEAMMLAAAARWVASDDSPAIGIVLARRLATSRSSTGSRGFAVPRG